MAYPQLDMKFMARRPKAPEKEADKTKLWYDGWQADARQDIFEENHYHTNMCKCHLCDPSGQSFPTQR